jgi:hypothetical protein
MLLLFKKKYNTQVLWKYLSITFKKNCLTFAAKSKTMEFIKDLWGFMMERKKFWLIPVIVVLLLIGVLIVFGGGSAAAPFIYTLF